jgi:hypothetical protein
MAVSTCRSRTLTRASLICSSLPQNRSGQDRTGQAPPATAEIEPPKTESTSPPQRAGDPAESLKACIFSDRKHFLELIKPLSFFHLHKVYRR